MIKIAFAGNPNVGKSALINALAGSKLKVGNWPGVTVEKKEAYFTYKGQEITMVDLPGVYSLRAVKIFSIYFEKQNILNLNIQILGGLYET